MVVTMVPKARKAIMASMEFTAFPEVSLAAHRKAGNQAGGLIGFFTLRAFSGFFRVDPGDQPFEGMFAARAVEFVYRHTSRISYFRRLPLARCRLSMVYKGGSRCDPVAQLDRAAAF